MHDSREEQTDRALVRMARLRIAPPLRLAGAEEDEDDYAIVRGID